MGDKLNDAIVDLQHKHNFANLKEEYKYVNAVKEAITSLEGSGGGGGVTEQFVNDAVKVETDARVLADEALQTGANNTFVTKADGADAIASLATKSGLYKDPDDEAVDLETQCQSFEARVVALETPASRQATLSNEQMKQMEGNILAELLKKMAK